VFREAARKKGGQVLEAFNFTPIGEQFSGRQEEKGDAMKKGQRDMRI